MVSVSDVDAKMDPMAAWLAWIAAVTSSATFIVIAATFWKDVRIRRESQARLVYSRRTDLHLHATGEAFELLPANHILSVDFGYRIERLPAAMDSMSFGRAPVPILRVSVVTHNGSDELIGPVRVQLVDVGRGRVFDEFSALIETIEPHTDAAVQFTWPNPDHPGLPGLGSTVIFRDASGRWWRRHLAEPIELVHADPENVGPTPRERIAIRAQQQAEGISPLLEEPRLSLRVRWHRVLRMILGKSPIP